MDNVHENSTHLFGLVGRNISYSFSRGYFSDKFQKLQLTGHHYTNFDIQSIEEFPDVITQNPTLIGLNVTSIQRTDHSISYLLGPNRQGHWSCQYHQNNP